MLKTPILPWIDSNTWLKNIYQILYSLKILMQNELHLYKQPESDEERNLCEEALAGCPVEAIGRDGEE